MQTRETEINEAVNEIKKLTDFNTTQSLLVLAIVELRENLYELRKITTHLNIILSHTSQIRDIHKDICQIRDALESTT